MTTAEVFVGIDVSKARLDVAVGSAGELIAVDNDARGIVGLAGRLRKLGSELIVLEASGGLSAATRPVNFALIAAVRANTWSAPLTQTQSKGFGVSSNAA